MLSQEHMDKHTQEQRLKSARRSLTICIATCLFLSLNLVAVRKFYSAYFTFYILFLFCVYNAEI